MQIDRPTAIYILAVLIFFSGIAWLYVGPRFLGTVTERTEEEVVRATVNAQAQMAPGDVRAAEFVPQNEVPADIAAMIPRDANDIVASSAAFTGGKGGYTVSFKIAKPLQSTFIDLWTAFRGTSTWKVVTALQGSTAGLLEVESERYKVHINFDALSESQTKVVMQAVSKQ